MSHATTHPLTPNALHISDYDITFILKKYNSPLILTIDGSFRPSPIPRIYHPRQPHHPTTAYAAASVTITTINNSTPSRNWIHLPTISILSRVQPLPAAYGTNNVINNTAELLARILVCELIPPHTPAIIINDSAVVYSQHMALVDTTSTHRQLTRTVFPAISRMLAQRLEASQTGTLPRHDPPTPLPTPFLMGPLTLHETIVLQIGQMGHCGKIWNPTRHATVMGAHLCVKIKSHQLRPNGTPKYNTGSQPCLALIHSNHWADKTCELPFSLPSSHPFSITCVHSRITFPLYYYPMKIFYGLYPVDTDVSDFVATAY